MSETPLTADQANALSGATDSGSDFVFPTIGESPYYTTLFRCLDRLLVIGRTPGNALRVFQDGGLTFGVRPGLFWDGFQTRSYGGAATQALTNNATNTIYLLADGTLTISTVGFPTQPHVPLATIVTSGGAYEAADITDYRGAAFTRLAGGLSISAAAENNDDRIVTVQGLTGRNRLRVWVAAADFGSPSAAGHTAAVTAGTVLREVVANADYEVITAADGAAALTVTLSGAGSRYVLAESDGRIFSSGELTWSA